MFQPFCREGEVDDQNGVFLHKAAEQEHADEGDDGELLAADHERDERAAAGGRQRGEDGQRVDKAFVQYAEHDIEGDNGCQDEDDFRFDCIGEELGVALEAAEYVVGHAYGRARILYNEPISATLFSGTRPSRPGR